VQRLFFLLWQQQRFNEAQSVLATMPEHAPVTAYMQRIVADMALGTEDYDRAIAVARKVVDDNSKSYRDYIWLGQIYWAAKHPLDAEQALRRAVELARTQPEAWVALVQF